VLDTAGGLYAGSLVLKTFFPEAGQDSARARFNLALRELRRDHPWLGNALGPDDEFDHRWPCDGTVLFHGMRRPPDGQGAVLLESDPPRLSQTGDSVTQSSR